jgi:protein TonB
MSTRKHYQRYLPHAASTLVILGVVAGMLWFINTMLNSAPPTGKKTVQQITLLQPPPPPPPPKVEEPPPEPEVVEEKTPDPEPQETDQASDDVPPGEDLGLDADGGAGGDAFGLVGKKGARDLIGGGGGRLAWYNGILKRDIVDQLSEIECLRARKYTATVKLWLSSDGSVNRFELSGSSGNADTDACLRAASKHVRQISERPPDEITYPVRIRITSRT